MTTQPHLRPGSQPKKSTSSRPGMQKAPRPAERNQTRSHTAQRQRAQDRVGTDQPAIRALRGGDPLYSRPYTALWHVAWLRQWYSIDPILYAVGFPTLGIG
ncbi:Hypothetical predicted protein [Pelobates cultripes]|uniref:Uncharacterized protein n=1 Tax=Pelobates cultripes TaxID=61616 RepID=A0AAD1TBB7_PELCU|nr:Hypothetical predicted protein [Pelobates cultripes]